MINIIQLTDIITFTVNTLQHKSNGPYMLIDELRALNSFLLSQTSVYTQI
ncbi:MAG: hypothetical protein ACI828_001257 [Flavobacteriales bacterium]|jgi:hypothetical protein